MITMKNTKKAMAWLLMLSCACSAASCGKKGNYVHGKKGYYSQVDNGYGTEVVNQGGYGNCWAHAALASMRSHALIAGETPVTLTIDDIMMSTYSAEKTEGLRVKSAGQEKNIGGNQINTAWGLSNGYKGFTLTELEWLNEAKPVVFHGEDSYEYTDLATRDQIKDILKNKGAVVVSLLYGAGDTLSHDYYTVYDRTFVEMNCKPVAGYYSHNAIIVGWDDNFPKEYFGQEYGKTIPKEDGAWLLQNSSGTTWGVDGYAWVSYESALTFDAVLTVTDKYGEVLSYEAGAPGGIKTGDETVVANVFHHAGKLSAVGTYVGVCAGEMHSHVFGEKDNTRITVEVRDANMDKVLWSRIYEFDFEGYYVVELDEPIDVEDFSVVIRYNGAAPVEGVDPESLEEGSKHSGVEYVTGIEKGQSFVYLDGQWLDLADPATQEKIDFECDTNNCSIKALFAK